MSAVAAGPLHRHLRVLQTAFVYEMRKQSAFRGGFLVREIVRGVDRGIVMAFVYAALYRAAGTDRLGGYTYRDMIAYLVLVAVLGKLLFHERALDLSDQIFEGYVTKYVVMPVRFFTLVLARWLQYIAVQSLVVVVLMAVGPLVLRGWWPRPDAASLGMAAVLVLLASYCYLLLFFILHSMAFWLDVVWSLLAMARMTCGFVMGELVPISLMPPAVEGVFRLLFPYWALCGPVEILLGRQDASDFRTGVAVLLSSAVLLQALAALTWRRGLRLYAGAGA